MFLFSVHVNLLRLSELSLSWGRALALQLRWDVRLRRDGRDNCYRRTATSVNIARSFSRGAADNVGGVRMNLGVLILDVVLRRMRMLVLAETIRVQVIAVSESSSTGSAVRVWATRP